MRENVNTNNALPKRSKLKHLAVDPLAQVLKESNIIMSERFFHLRVKNISPLLSSAVANLRMF